jgi:hypothetical protein
MDESRMIRLVQPHHGLVLVTEPYIDQRNIASAEGFFSFRNSRLFAILVASSRCPENGKGVRKTRIEHCTMTRNFYRFLKLENCFVSLPI